MDPSKTGALTRAEILSVAAHKCAVTQRQAEQVLDCMLQSMSAALVAQRDIDIRTFGTFRVSVQEERVRKNPQTHEDILVGPSLKIKFKLASALVEAAESNLREGVRVSKRPDPSED